MDSENKVPYQLPRTPHPGEMVVEYLDAYGWSQRDLSRRSGLTPKTISEICNGKAPITPTTSLAFEKVFQRPAHFWLNLQRQYDEAEARRTELARSENWKEWAIKFPLKELRRLGFVSPSDHKSDVESLLNFFGVSSPDSWKVVWQASAAAYRQTRKFKTSDEAVSAWVRATELAANDLQVADFSEQNLRSSIGDLLKLTRRRASEIMEPVQALCGAAGVAVVWVPELKQTGISGCARWLSDRKALVALSLRYKTDDQMWFTFFHEIGHILLHRRSRSFVLDNAADDLSDRIIDPEMQTFEDEANRFSSDTLIPPTMLAQFVDAGDFGNDAIHEFAERVGVGPGIVVGRLQHEQILEPHQGNVLKQKLEFRIDEQ